jgi:hypothetical protein
MGKEDFFHTPVRRPGSNNVYRVSGMLRHMLNRRDWRDFSVWRLTPENLTRVAVERTTDSFAVERDADGTWWFSEPTSGPVDSEKVQNWTRRVATLKANEFEEASDPDMLTTFGLTSPSARMSVAAEDGSSFTLAFGNLEPEKKQYYAKRTDDPQVYRFYEYTYNDVLKKSADLKPAPKPKPTPRPVPTPTPPPAPGRPTTGPARLTPPTPGDAAPTTPPMAPVPPLAPPPDGPTTAPLP